MLDFQTVNPIQDGLSANLFGTGGGADSAPPPKFSACGARRAPKLIHPKSCDVYEANKKKIGPIAQKLGPWAPIQNFNLMADLAERHILRKFR